MPLPKQYSECAPGCGCTDGCAVQRAEAAERMACARIALDMRARWLAMKGTVAMVSEDAAGKIAEAIRERNQP